MTNEVLARARLLRDELERRGARVLMTRTEDVAVELPRRAEVAIEGSADLFLSVHHNATADPAVTTATPRRTRPVWRWAAPSPGA